MKEAIDEVKNEVKAKLLLWKNIKSRKVKVIFIFLFLGLVGLKVFTTVYYEIQFVLNPTKLSRCTQIHNKRYRKQ